MPHIRTELRRELVETLTAANITGIGANVFNSRKYRAGKVQLPLMSVYILEDDVQPEVGAMAQDPPFRHDTVATVEAHVSGLNGLEVADLLDQINLEMDAALVTNLDLGGFADTGLTPRDINFAFQTESDSVTGVGTYTYSVTYRATLSDESTPAP